MFQLVLPVTTPSLLMTGLFVYVYVCMCMFIVQHNTYSPVYYRGAVYTCGLNDAHQLGLGNSAMNAPKNSLSPKQVCVCMLHIFAICLVLPMSKVNLKGRTVIAVGAGRYHSAMCTEHEVFTFGKNLGQLGMSICLYSSFGCGQ